MSKRTHSTAFSIAFKREVIDYMEEHDCSPNKACKYFQQRDKFNYDPSTFYQYKKNAKKIAETPASKKRSRGGGRKPALGSLEEIIVEEIIWMRSEKMKVTRQYIADRARLLAKDCNVVLKASSKWVNLFLRRHGFSLRRRTNVSTISDQQLIHRAASPRHFWSDILRECGKWLSVKKIL